MSDTQEKSDDLIAELAKLMASSAQGTEAGPKPTVIKLPPLSEATVQTAPVRIPGMEPSKPASAALDARPASVSSSTPAIRIPGMERPTGISEPAPAPAPKLAAIDFGKPPSAAAIAAEPLANWQTREVPKAAPRPSAPAEGKFEPTRAPAAQAPMMRSEPVVASPLQASPPAASFDVAPKPRPADNFNFDFGFGGGSAGEDKPAPQHDPIADLITAELDASDRETPREELLPAPVPPRVAQVQPQAVVPKAVVPAPQRSPTAVAIKPVTVTPRPSESDRFAVAPVFGFNTKAASAATPAPQPMPAPVPAMTARPAPRGDFDPMDEIEDLIGDAVRSGIGGDKPKEKTVAPAPVVPPLNTGFAPRRAGIKDSDAGVQSAEAAIIAAAASSGVELGRVDTPAGEDRPYKRMKVKPPKTSFLSSGARQYVGIAVAGTLLLASGFGLYWVLGMNRSGSDAAPVLTADTNPTKVEPTAVVASTAEPARSIVFDEIEGTNTAADETLVSRDETAGVEVADVARVVTPPAESEGLGGLNNRRVRTVTVRPDGTIVSGDEAVAGAAELPVDRPNVPTIEGAELERSDLLTAVAENTGSAPEPVAPSVAADPIAALVAETVPATTAPLAEPAPLEVAAVEPEAVAPVFDASIVAPTPAAVPTFRGGVRVAPVELLTVEEAAAIEPNEPAATPLVALAQPETSAPVDPSSAGAYVQLASVTSQSDAEAQVRSQTARHGSLFGGSQLVVQRADVADKGVRFRVRLPVDSLQNATRICASIKANGGDCFATNS